MKKIAKITAVVLALVLLLSLCACGGPESALAGKWESNEAPGTYYEFKTDGTGVLSGTGYSMDLTYTVKDDTITFTYAGSTATQTFNYTIKDNVLSLIDSGGATLTYTKK